MSNVESSVWGQWTTTILTGFTEKSASHLTVARRIGLLHLTFQETAMGLGIKRLSVIKSSPSGGIIAKRSQGQACLGASLLRRRWDPRTQHSTHSRPNRLARLRAAGPTKRRYPQQSIFKLWVATSLATHAHWTRATWNLSNNVYIMVPIFIDIKAIERTHTWRLLESGDVTTNLTELKLLW